MDATESTKTSIKKKLAHIKKSITEFEKKYEREKDSVHLLAASKGQSIEKMSEAFRAGQYRFGENYLQEALVKISALSLIAPEGTIEWHFIGSIQSNKASKIAEHFSWVHTIADKKIAKRLNDHRSSELPRLNICIEVNVNGESTKSGISINEVKELADYCLSLPRLHLRGLMAIPAPREDFADQCAEFHKLFLLWQSLRDAGIALDTLSMGMSEDYEAAIAEGATLVRIGTDIFGKRGEKKNLSSS